MVVALPEKKKERLCERKVVLFGDYLDDTGEIIKKWGELLEVYEVSPRAEGIWHALYPKSTLMHR
jgi:hypothetical protein